MGKIHLAEAAAGPARALFDELRRLHRLAGEPSTRDLARKIGPGMISHTTVHSALRGPRVPRWPVLELLVEPLGGDCKRIKELWLAARDIEDAQDGTGMIATTTTSSIPPRVITLGDGSTRIVSVREDDPPEEVVVSDADRLAMAAMFRGYFLPLPHYDPFPSSYVAAAKTLDWPRTALVKRIEYLRARLTKAGVPNLEGWNALHRLAEYAIACRLLTQDDIDSFVDPETLRQHS